MSEILYIYITMTLHAFYVLSFVETALWVMVQQTWLGDVRSGTPSTSETGTTGGLLHRSPELSPLGFFYSFASQGCSGIEKKDPGSIFFAKANSSGLTNLPNQEHFYI